MGWVQHIFDRMQMNYQDEFYDDELEEFQEEKHFNFMDHFKSIGVGKLEEEALMQVVMIRAKSVEDSKEICDQLLIGCVVIINMEEAPEEQKSRIIDFISGVLYGLNGSLLLVSQVIYLAAPEDIELANGERLVDRLE